MYNVVVGVDISKLSLDTAIVKLHCKEALHDNFLNQKLGFDQLWAWVQQNKQSQDELLFCMEHTGYYGHKLCRFLEKKGLAYALVNPLQIKRSMGLRREKSDQADAQMIAWYGMKFQEQLSLNTIKPADMISLQLLLAHRKRIQRKEMDLKRQSISLKHCLSTPTAKEINKSIDQLRKRLMQEFRKIEKRLDTFVQEHKAIRQNYELLVSIPGVGKVIAWYTIVHTHNFTQIQDARKFACFCGVAPFKNESGTSLRKKASVSYIAHRQLKSYLNFGALNAVKWDPQLKAYYERKQKEGKE